MRGGLLGARRRPGDRVALVWPPTTGTSWSSYLAVLGVGAVAVPLNPLSPAPELSSASCAASGARPGHRRARRAPRPSPGVDLDARRHVARRGVLTARRRPAGARRARHAVVERRADDDLAVLVFTSGTAGSPKAAMLTHGNLRANIDQVLVAARARSRAEVALAALPLFHIFGLNAVLGVALAAGWTIVLMERFDAHAALEAMRRARRHRASAACPRCGRRWATLPGRQPRRPSPACGWPCRARADLDRRGVATGAPSASASRSARATGSPRRRRW